MSNCGTRTDLRSDPDAPRSRARRRSSGPLARATTSATVVVTILMALASGASATVVTAPYRHSLASTTTYLDANGCGTGSITSPVNWSVASGTVTTGVNSTAKLCGTVVAGIGAYSGSRALAEFELAVPIHINVSGKHSIDVHWKVHATTAWSYATGSCAAVSKITPTWYCDESAGWVMIGGNYLVDATNNTIDYGSFWENYNETYNESYFAGSKETNYSYTSSAGHAGNVTLFLNTTSLNRADKYVLVTYLAFEAYSNIGSYEATFTGGSAASMISVAGPGNKAVLASIVVS